MKVKSKEYLGNPEEIEEAFGDDAAGLLLLFSERNKHYQKTDYSQTVSWFYSPERAIVYRYAEHPTGGGAWIKIDSQEFADCERYLLINDNTQCAYDRNYYVNLTAAIAYAMAGQSWNRSVRGQTHYPAYAVDDPCDLSPDNCAIGDLDKHIDILAKKSAEIWGQMKKKKQAIADRLGVSLLDFQMVEKLTEAGEAIKPHHVEDWRSINKVQDFLRGQKNKG